MTHHKIKAICLLLCFILMIVSAAVITQQQKQFLIIESQETGQIYVKVPTQAGEEVSFGWEHSFEHIPWNEYYEIKPDKTFVLHTISVAGFGAGIPAEMDCTYRYEDGLVYMDHIESEFPRFNWINSQTALKSISLNGNLLIKGADMPHHEKITLYIK